MANVKLRLSRLEARYGSALRGEIDIGLMSPNELADSISNMLIDAGVHPKEAEKQVSHMRMGTLGDEKPRYSDIHKYRSQSKSFSQLSNKELKGAIVSLSLELGLTLPDFEIV